LNHDTLERVFREEAGFVLASLIKTLRDFDLAEEAFADAIGTATETWPRDGVPRNPAAWLTTTARRRAIDRLRHRAMRAGKRAELQLEELDRRRHASVEPAVESERAETDSASREGPPSGDSTGEHLELTDERLRLIFTCCHPALPLEARVALTLRTLGGLTTGQVASAFLVSETTMARRLVRAKTKIRDAKIPYRVPTLEDMPERLQGVLAVLYLIFNQGYASAAADDARRALCGEAISLAGTLASLLPEEPEVLGLLALMWLHDGRRDARCGPDGCMVPLEEQDPARWRDASIRTGLDALESAAALGRPGPYQLQAAISATHIDATRQRADASERWDAVAALYEVLENMTPSPVVTLNRAVAVGRSRGPEAGLALIDSLLATPEVRHQLVGYQPFYAVHADLLHRVGDCERAAVAYRRAIELAEAEPERMFLTQQLANMAQDLSR